MGEEMTDISSGELDVSNSNGTGEGSWVKVGWSLQGIKDKVCAQ